MESRKEVIMLLHFEDDTGKQEQLGLMRTSRNTTDQKTCVLSGWEPVDISFSQQALESSGVLGGGDQSFHTMHHLSRRSPAVCYTEPQSAV